MITPEQIPDEVVEAAAMQLPGMAGHQRYVRAAIAAALNAWPGIEIHTDGTEDWIELTLTQEPRT
jgi:hypothetical protein